MLRRDRGETDAPVLVIAYRRPKLTRELLERLEDVYGGRKVYVFVDGPRVSAEVDAWSEVTEVVSAFQESSGADVLLSKGNLGCRQGVTTAIDWFFDQVDQGFILEDDCYPNADFFRLGNFVLDSYKHDRRVAQFSGRRQVAPDACSSVEAKAFEFDYLGSTWGWATWADRWEGFDRGLRQLRNKEAQVSLESFRRVMPVRAAEVIRGYNAVADGSLDTWDYQWAVSRLLNGSLSAVPAKNLIENRGSGKLATHTSGSFWGMINQAQNLPESDFSVLEPKVSPRFVRSANREAWLVKQLSRLKRGLRQFRRAVLAAFLLAARGRRPQR